MKSLINKICIGTAQFNQKYGISNNNVLKKKDFFQILNKIYDEKTTKKTLIGLIRFIFFLALFFPI